MKQFNWIEIQCFRETVSILWMTCKNRQPIPCHYISEADF
uniref:Uncharacterized protein n=1 Tax=Arundo donax TaxID=35708 RepID=A0A0A9EEE7_ARUDO